MKKKETKTNKITLILLIISIISMIGTGIYFIILKDKNKSYDQELTNLNTNIIKAKDKLENDKDEKEEKDKKLEDLEKELKDNVEELEVWKELKKELEESLS